MLQKFAKTLMFLTTVVAVPYTVAILSNILYGWPPKKNKFKRALNPRKVLALNYTCLQLIYRNFKYAPLWVRWTRFYRSLDPHLVRKNLAYGKNEQTLDLYLPEGVDLTQPRPVVVFVYGGAWSSGNKKMYGMLCSEIAQTLKCLVCCPNYATYPQGYVDDQVQDIVDCVGWINQNVRDYGGDKNKIMMVGHSAGAHLCIMAALELLHDELMQPPEASSQLESLRIKFEESHFNGSQKRDNNALLEQSSGSTSSFVVLNDNGEKANGSNNGNNASTFDMLDNGAEGVSDIAESGVEKSDSSEGATEGVSVEDSKSLETKIDDSIVVVKGADEEEEDVPTRDNSSVETVVLNDEGGKSLIELGHSIQAIIGLAGVYNIADHYDHEASRGIEDVSRMARAMYGEEHFDRFSPSLLCQNIVNSLCLPKIILVHGTDDHVVPVSSTSKLADILTEKFADITVRILPGCDHYEVCLDLMQPKHKCYESVMGIIMETASKVLK